MNYNEISVLIQGGGCDDKTVQSIESVKAFLPNAEIVLATWKGENLLDIEKYGVRTILLDDPGRIKNASLANTNRQILGRKEGLKLCTRPYTLIMRQDSKIINLNFIEQFERDYKTSVKTLKVFEHRIVACSTNPYSLFFLCDWFFFGRTGDVQKLYDVELFDDKPGEYVLPEYRTSHERLGVYFARKYKSDFSYEYNNQGEKKYKSLWQNLLVDNFIMVGFYKNYGIINLKEPYYTNQLRNSKFSYSAIYHLMLNFELEDWLKLYESKYGKTQFKPRFRLEYYCSLPLRSLWKIKLKLIKIKSNIRRRNKPCK